jgi:RNA polymerase sigma-70 factor (ECF subfamily)
MRPRLVEVDVDVAAVTIPVDQYGAVSAAFESYHAELYNFLRRSTRDEAAAEDLLQEAYLRLTREVDAGRTPEHVRGWLYRVASNLAISRGRRRTTAFEWMGRYGRHSLGDDVASPEAGMLARERTSAIDAVLATLPAEARTALLLSADGFSGEEIAVAIGRSHGATRTLLSRTRVRVRLELEQRGDVR